MGKYSLQIKSTAKRILAHNPLGKKLIQRHPRKIVEIKRLIEREGFRIPPGAVKKTKSGVVISRSANGDYTGQMSTATFRINFGKKTFFVRYKLDTPSEKIDRYQRARELFANKTVNGYNVRVIMPHIIYGEKKVDDKGREITPTFIVTDYLDQRRGTLYQDYFDGHFATKDPALLKELIH
jgi:hypothetical protein